MACKENKEMTPTELYANLDLLSQCIVYTGFGALWVETVTSNARWVLNAACTSWACDIN